MRLLIIRPQPGADATAARAALAGFEPAILPFFEIRPRRWNIPDTPDYDALLVTSANALRHAGAGLASLTALPVHAVGLQSAEFAREAGFILVSAGRTDANAALVDAAKTGHRRLLWLTGEDHAALVIPPDVSVDMRISYASERLILDDAAKAQIAGCSLVALHSARAAMGFAEMVDVWGLPRSKYCLAAFSSEIGVAAGIGWRKVVVASCPQDSALLSAVQSAVRMLPGEFERGEND